MILVKHVVAAIDLSDSSATVLECAGKFACSFSAALHVVHVVDDLAAHGTRAPLAGIELGRLQTELEEDARTKLDALLADQELAKGSGAVVLTSRRPAPAILAYARDIDADLIVSGTHGRDGFAEWFLGSVAQELVRTAACPVLTIRQTVPCAPANGSQAAA